MYRVYKDFIRKMLVTLVYFREQGFSFAHTDNYVRQNIYRDHGGAYVAAEERAALMQALSFYDGLEYNRKNTNLDELISMMVKQLNSKTELNDRDLIDTIVRTLGLPYAKNFLAGSSIGRLRDAILVPDELIELKTALTKESSCSGCGHKFENGEMSSFLSSDKGGVFVCSRCRKPSYVASDTDSKVSIPVSEVKGLQEVLKKKFSCPALEQSEPGVMEYIREIGLDNARNQFIGMGRRQGRAADIEQFLQDGLIPAPAWGQPQPEPGGDPNEPR